jgi:ADP-ribosyl-[dinitrogen reductase] hydrolase
MINSELLQEKRKACLFGGAIGDAFGYEIEFSSIAAIHNHYGETGLQQPVFHDGKLIVSDDTQMTLFTLEAINSCDAKTSTSDVIERVRMAYLDWYHTQREDAEHFNFTGAIGSNKVLLVTRAPGNCCMNSMATGGSGTPETPINDNKGCGGVMRVAPLGFYPAKWNANQVFELAMRAAAITHTHPTGYLSAGSLAALIFFLIQEKEIQNAIEETKSVLKNYSSHSETIAKIDQAISFASSDMKPLTAIEALGQGWIAEEALGIGLFSALRGGSYTEVIQIAANHTGDSDSTASIAGQIYGAWKGANEIPNEWMDSLDVYDVMVQLLSKV